MTAPHPPRTPAEVARRYKLRMQRQGFVRASIWLDPRVLDRLYEMAEPGECYGRTLERLLLGRSSPREIANHYGRAGTWFSDELDEEMNA